MFYDKSKSGDENDEESFGSQLFENVAEDEEFSGGSSRGRQVGSVRQGGYDREVILSVWEFAEVVPGNDPDLWRKDEHGDWIYRFDYGRRNSDFGWEIFDPGIWRHAQGVFAMRPMQWQSYIRQYESLA